ncbi:MAG: hypothetical protein J6584_04520 [Lactobacillus sp.]|uniref:hypothetical protein n=1 Tax=Bombilactobacillus bombi TaxID=1303590 RepID=UPI0035ECDD0C|nr:hypothetical protein [Lactobacillus sp.]
MNTVINIKDSSNKIKIPVPVKFNVPNSINGDLWVAYTQEKQEVICQRLHNDKKFNFIAIISLKDNPINLKFDHQISIDKVNGIKTIAENQENDAYIHLNTGVFDLELCRGNAKGEGSSKWGLRHFKSNIENKDLLPSGNNAIGGFYGPFFTPDNGLINPAEHIIVDISVLEDGPILKQYRLAGRIPDGLKPELHGKRFSLDWSFYYNVPFFSRIYNIDHFETTVNKRSITDKITVGDEFESGKGQLVFDRFDSYNGTWYREGDPYANKLAEKVKEIVIDDKERGEQFKKFKKALTGDMASAHWDLYWRLFSVWENALNEDEIKDQLHDVRSKAFVLAELNNRMWKFSNEAINVSQVPDQTIFAGPATKSAEFNTKTGQSMIWQTSQASGAFQIVQRPESGWQNWGANAENECPALPVGSLINTAYGPYKDNWRQIADSMEEIPNLQISIE